MSALNLSLVQSSTIWENPEANRKHLTELLNLQLTDQTDIIILPEMFTTGFSMNTKVLAETMDGPSVQWMKQISHKFQCAVCGSLIILEAEKYYNRFIWVDHLSTEIRIYDKSHLFSLAGEENYYTAGQDKQIFTFKSWKIMPLICYDLRFPVWMRNTQLVDLMICVANFAAKRRKAWNSLLPARAIENVCFLAGVNIIGTDGNAIEYSGDSSVYNYEGDCMVELNSSIGVKSVSLDLYPMQVFRRAYPFLKDQDEFVIKR
ncbi:MAG: nitrilase family protein [Bacteroidota bacterium]|nr:nitrilase family protein [Bacteroidota bacterium]